MSKIRAASIHLAICIVIALILLCLLWFVYYPDPLLEAIGGREIFLMLLGIDIVLGPVLTFVVFKAGKKSLKFDLAVIAGVQLAALAYGVFTLWEGRPVYIAALGHKFDVVRAADVQQKELDIAKQSLPLFGPKWTGIKIATDEKEKDRVLMSALAGADYGHFPQHHIPLEAMSAQILEKSKSIADLKKLNTGKDAEIDAWLKSHGTDAASARFQILNAPVRPMAVIVDGKTAKVIGIAPFSSI